MLSAFRSRFTVVQMSFCEKLGNDDFLMSSTESVATFCFPLEEKKLKASPVKQFSIVIFFIQSYNGRQGLGIFTLRRGLP